MTKACKDVENILKRLRKADAVRDGWTVKETSDRHFIVRHNGAYVTTLSSRPGDFRALRNSRADLRAAGFVLDNRP